MNKAKKFAKTEMKEALAELEQRIAQCHEKVIFQGWEKPARAIGRSQGGCVCVCMW